MTAPFDRTTITAHAGCLGTEPNTVESFVAALARPVDLLEADVRFGPAGSAYLSHDEAPAAKRKAAMSLDELLDLVAPRPGIRLNLDLKEYSALGAMADLISRKDMRKRVLLTGVEEGSIAALRDGGVGLPYYLNAAPSFVERFTRRGAEALAARIRGLGAIGLNTHFRFASLLLARTISAAGLSFSVWTVDGERDLRRFLLMGAGNITTRRIDLALALRDGREIGRGAAGGEGR